MTVDRSYGDHQTRYVLRDGAAVSCVLIFDASQNGQAAWKILLPGPGGTEDQYGAKAFAAPDGGQLRMWLAPVVGADRATELASAVDAQPPHESAWTR